MNTFNILLLLILTIVAVNALVLHPSENTKLYVTRNGLTVAATSQEHAETLSRIHEKLQIIVKHTSLDVDGFSGNLVEIPRKQGMEEVAYSLNKGEKIALCVDGQDENTMLYVAIHELAHVATKDTGHSEEFWKNFETLLREAVDLGVYEYQPFHKHGEEYCGVKIDNTPFICNNCNVYKAQ